MDKIHLREALLQMRDRDTPFSISFITYNPETKKGGEVIPVDRAQMCGLPYYSKQRIGIKNLDNLNYHPMAVHIRLITHFNGLRVIS